MWVSVNYKAFGSIFFIFENARDMINIKYKHTPADNV